MALPRSMPAHSQMLAGCPVVSLCCVAVLCPCFASKSSCNLGSMSSCADERIDGGDVHGNETCCVSCHSVAKKLTCGQQIHIIFLIFIFGDMQFGSFLRCRKRMTTPDFPSVVNDACSLSSAVFSRRSILCPLLSHRHLPSWGSRCSHWSFRWKRCCQNSR